MTLWSCSVTNIFKGPSDYNKHYFAQDLQKSIDIAIEYERLGNSAPGYNTQSYSWENWNRYWNDRIFSIHKLGNEYKPEKHVGPSGQQYIQYIFQERAKYGLPKLDIEERNRGKLPNA